MIMISSSPPPISATERILTILLCGDDLSTQFAVAFQNTDARIGLTHSFGQCGGVDLDALTHIDQTLQDLHIKRLRFSVLYDL